MPKAKRSTQSSSRVHLGLKGWNLILKIISLNDVLPEPPTNRGTGTWWTLNGGLSGMTKSESVFLKESMAEIQSLTARVTTRQWREFSFWWTEVRHKEKHRKTISRLRGKAETTSSKWFWASKPPPPCEKTKKQKGFFSVEDRASSSDTHLVEVMATRNTTLWVRIEKRFLIGSNCNLWKHREPDIDSMESHIGGLFHVAPPTQRSASKFESPTSSNTEQKGQKLDH